MDSINRVRQHFLDSVRVKQASMELLTSPLVDASECVTRALLDGGRVLACGNGGSAADAQHFAAELVGRFETERQELSAIALTTDTSILTAVGNDYGFSRIFSRQVLALGRAGDVLLAISTSGNSENVLAALHAAHEREMRVIALTGAEGGKMRELLRAGDILLAVPDKRTARVQETHLLLIHCLCDAIDNLLTRN